MEGESEIGQMVQMSSSSSRWQQRRIPASVLSLSLSFSWCAFLLLIKGAQWNITHTKQHQYQNGLEFFLFHLVDSDIRTVKM